LRFSIFTPCRNAAGLIEETMRSVLYQTAVRTGAVELDYHILDGNSHDGTAERARAFDHPSVRVISQPDRGVYDALARGLAGAQGDVIAYVNAGDVYHLRAFEIVADILQDRNVRWLTGFRTALNTRSQITGVEPQRPVRTAFFENGFYGGQILPAIQQESTFWRRELHDAVDWEKFSTFRLAGDFFLWQQFARGGPPACVDGLLGAFRIHPGQLSEDAGLYAREVAGMARPSTWRERLTARLDRDPHGWMNQLLRPFGLPAPPATAFYYDHRTDQWRIYR
jgi:hypothetical protein